MYITYNNLLENTVPTINLTKENFEETILNNDIVILDFWAEWCGPCKMIYPTFVGLSEELPEVTFVKIMGDTDLESRALMKEWGVRVVPLFLLFRNGERIGEWSGAKADILKENVRAACNDDEK